MRARVVVAAMIAAMAAAARPTAATDLFAGYSELDLRGQWARGGVAGVALPMRGGAVRVGLDGSAHFGRRESVRELALLASVGVMRRAAAHLAPFFVLRAGGAGLREQVDVFGVPIGRDGVCDGSCPYTFGPAAEGGVGLDVRLVGRWHVRVAADYRARRLSGEFEHGLRVSAGLAHR